METRITELFGIQHPIMLSGVSFGSDPKLTAAVSNAGGLGILGGAVYTPDTLREAIGEIRSLTDKPFGVNITLTTPGVRELIKVLIEAKVPVINYALGRAAEVVKASHEYGGKVIGTVAMLRHALRSEQDGADALSVTGHEAAAHGGNVTSLVLIPTIASRVKVPILGTGGFCDGRGLAAALVLGAEGIGMGTAFMLTKESISHERAKESFLKASEESTIISDRWDGMPGRLLKTEVTEALLRRRFPVIESVTGTLRLKRLLRVSLWELLRGALRTAKAEEISLRKLSHRTVAFLQLERALIDGDLENGILPAGQVCGRINDIPSCSELIERIVSEAEEILEATRGKNAS